MASIIGLGTFTKVDLKEAWPTENGNFTPWLAQKDSIILLGDALNLELEVEAVEHWVGPFRADILARVIESEGEQRVVIENQFGRTNHGHLGQILTYLAGIENAKTVVWIAEMIQPDHRAAIDWLNANTTEVFSFFALEIELWRIGNSPPAPRFNVVASPNDWSKEVRSTSRQLGEAPTGDLQRLYLEYWTALREVFRQRVPNVMPPKALPQTWWQNALGRTGYHLNSVIRREQSKIVVEVYIQRKEYEAKYAFRELMSEKDAIESAFGYPLSWEELPGNQGSRIAVYRENTEVSAKETWAAQHEWIINKLLDFRRVFPARIQQLSIPEEIIGQL